ncbi:MAG: FAD-dependent oxidoreductase [Clostridiales bacterium]|jgi:glutamate synthase (NADPH/NADH) small chain|nr:FAD-dependent oxidoreductase [Clostridiales bacterium]
MSLEKVKMPEQPAGARSRNFMEVALGYDEGMAVEEAGRCLRCKARPCVAGCPVSVAIPDFVALVAESRFDEAYAKVGEANALPAICGRVCPQETQCEQLCVRGRKGEPVAIGRLERFLGDRRIAMGGGRSAAGAEDGSGSKGGTGGNGGATAAGATTVAAAGATAAAAATAASEAGSAAASTAGGAARGAGATVASAAAAAGVASASAAAPCATPASEAGSAAVASEAGSPAARAAAAADVAAAGAAHAAGTAAAGATTVGADAAGAPATVASAAYGRKVAVVGSGPASLTCAGELAKRGCRVTVFEAFHVAGGVLMYGIPEFRLPKLLVQQEIGQLADLGVRIELNAVVGKTLDMADLWDEGYEAVFIGTGAGLPTFMRIPGENLCGVYSANEYLTRINLMKGYSFPEADTPVMRGRSVAVFGGGNVAMDAARCAKRLGADSVRIVYRRSEKEMPARAEEARHAAEEGVEFRLLTNPVGILGDGKGWVRGIECVRMELGEPDASGRRRPAAVAGSEFEIPADTVIVAIGQSPNPIIRGALPELKTESWGGIIADEATGATSIKGVYAGGDAVTGAATVILAMGAGKAAAKAMCEYLGAL